MNSMKFLEDLAIVIGSVGGLGAILTGLTYFISKIIINKTFTSWKVKNDKELEEIKGNINKSNSIVNSLTQQYGQNYRLLLEKRIEAAEVLWEAILEMKETIPATVSGTYTFFIIYADKKNEGLSNIPSDFKSDIININELDFVKKLSAPMKNLSKYRIHLSEKLWILMYAYQGFIGRTVHILKDGVRFDRFVNWMNDDGVKQILSTVLTSEELNTIRYLNLNSYESMFQLLESKILKEIKILISSEDLTMDSLTQINKIAMIDAENRKNQDLKT